MTEDDAKAWLAERYNAAAIGILAAYIDIIRAETANQNLIAPSTIDSIWSRHIVDSAQLLDHAPLGWSQWADIGSGAGLPGIVVAILTGKPIILVEPRRLRADFLRRCCDDLSLAGVTVVAARAETAHIDGTVDIVSARAVAKLDTIFSATRHFVTQSTTYILPKGASAAAELAMARQAWRGMFHVERSVLDPLSGIVVATGVAPR